MIKIIIFQHNEKGYMHHTVKGTFKNNNEDIEFINAINYLQELRGKQHG